VAGTPKFDNPPVVETVLGVQFPELPDFRCTHFGLYWDRIKERYPKCVDKGRLKPAAEAFPRKLVLLEPPVRIMRGGTAERVWYIAEDDARLIQLQPDRFICNWRELRGATKYPTYAKNSEMFLDEFSGFRRFCGESRLNEPSPNLCEVTYINHICPEDGESAIELFGRVFEGLCWKLPDDSLPRLPESATFNRAYVIADDVGRLYAQANIACHNETKRDLVRFEVTARVNHPSQDPEEIGSSLQLAHEWVVNGFVSMTNPEIQRERWKRTQ